MKAIFKRFRNSFSGQRRGSAIILALAMLSLLLIICMVFAFDARSSRTAAVSYSNTVRTRLLHDAGLNRSIVALKKFFSGNDDVYHAADNPDGYFVPPDALKDNKLFLSPGRLFRPATDDWAGDSYFYTQSTTNGYGSDNDGRDFGYPVSLRFTGLDGDTILYAPFSSSADENPSVGFEGLTQAMWVLDTALMDVSETGNADDVTDNSEFQSVVTGAFAYMVIDQTGKWDPAYLKWDDPAVTTDGETATNRTIDSMLEDIGYDAFNSAWEDRGYLGDSDMLGLPELYRNSNYDALHQEEIYKSLFPGQTILDPEEFWDDKNGDSLCNDSELFSRFDLSASRGSTKAEITELYQFLLYGDSSVEDSAMSDIAELSPWLRDLWNATDLAPRVDSVAKARRAAAQLAVFITDYLDADNKPIFVVLDDNTGGIKEVGTAPTEPTIDSDTEVLEQVVYGLENIGAGLQGIAVTLETDVTEDAAGDVVKPSVNFQVALGNGFGTVPSVNVDITYEYEFSYIDTSATPSSSPDPVVSSTLTIPVSGTGRHSKSQTLTAFTKSHLSLYNLEEFTIKKIELSVSSNVFRTYPLRVKGSDSSEIFLSFSWDSYKTASESSGIAWTLDATLGDAMFATCDPYDDTANLYWKMWHDTKGTAKSSVPTLGTGLTLPPDTYSSLAYCDVSANSSTGSFSGLGELGRVHHPVARGKSVRFWTADSTDGHGAWTDALLLDMFTTRPTGMYGRLNINTRWMEPARALFLNVANMDNLTKAQTAADALVALNNSTAATLSDRDPWVYRGEVCKIFDTSQSTSVPTANFYGATDDDMADAAIGGFIELCTTRSNYFSIVSIAQSLKDMKNEDWGKSVDPDTYKGVAGSNQTYKVESTYKTVSSIYKDALLGDIKVLRTDVLED